VLLEVPKRRAALAQLLASTGALRLMPGAVRTKLDPAPIVAVGFRMP
jgi:hypothetical protein